MSETSTVVKTAQDYYNSDGADKFYSQVWGGEDIHIGLYEGKDDSVFEASRRTVVKLASLLSLTKDTPVLDIGAGYGGAARYLAKNSGCSVTCLNLSEVQNQRNRLLNLELGLQSLIKVVDGNFEAIPLEDSSFQVVWSQDAILHSGDRQSVLQEVHRVLQSGGEFIFTDIMQRRDCSQEQLQPVLNRIHLDSLGSVEFYQETAATLGWEEIQWLDLSDQLVNHYSHILAVVNRKYEEVVLTCGQGYIDQMKVGLQHWIDAGNQGNIRWGILHFRKP